MAAPISTTPTAAATAAIWRWAPSSRNSTPLLLEKTGITDPAFADQWNRQQWPALKQKLADVIATRTRDEWCARFEGSDACVSPVLDLDEAPRHPHNVSRETFVDVQGVTQPAPAPRFSRTIPDTPRPPAPGEDGGAVLGDWGFSAVDVDRLRAVGAL